MDDSSIEQLQARIHQLEANSSVLAKAFRIIGATGDYLEFGAYTGGTMIKAWHAMKQIMDEFSSGVWDHSMSEDKESHAWVFDQWKKMRFITFDSFEGMPESTGVDKVYEVFPGGAMPAVNRSSLRIFGPLGSMIPGLLR